MSGAPQDRPLRPGVTLLPSGGPWEERFGYSRAVAVSAADLPAGTVRVLVSGSTATVDGELQHPGDAYGQMHVALDVIEAVLRRAGGGLDDVVRTRTYVTRVEDCDAVGRAHGERFATARPASTMVTIAALVNPAMLVEVEAEALVSPPERG